MDNILFRCSSLGHIMVESRTKSETLSETTKTHLIDKFVSYKYGRQTDISNKYIAKGLEVEEDSLTLYTRFKKIYDKPSRKNEQWLKNEFICGTPDLFYGESIDKADHVVDLKSSWDIFTFFRTKSKKLNPMYYWQLQGYMALTGAKQATLAYCLIDTPDAMINDEKRKLLWKMGVTTEDNPDYQEACIEIEKLCLYSDIPLEERVLETIIERDDEKIKQLYTRIKQCREYLKKL
jgi:hypothetical protein